MVGGGDAFTTEAMSCREALSWLKDLGYDNIILEYDAINMVHVGL